MALSHSLPLQLLRLWTSSLMARTGLRDMLHLDYPDTLQHFCAPIELELSSCIGHSPLRISNSNVLLLLFDNVHRSRHNSSQTIPITQSLKTPKIFDTSLRRNPSKLLFNMHDNPSKKSFSLFNLSKLLLNIRPSLWFHRCMYR